MPDAPAPALLALLYAGPGSALCRAAEGRLVVRPAGTWEDDQEAVVLTQEGLLEEGMDALLTLVA